MKEAEENPSIGIILCAEKDNFEVEYALKDISKPIGVSEFYLTRKLPEKYRKDLPSPELFKERLIKNKE